MNRKQLAKLAEWYKRSSRKPLILRGARQVGKSTLVRTFAKESGLELFEINLERHPELDDVFATLDLPRIITRLEGAAKKYFPKNNGIIFFDEIQATPNALAALRYFYEDRPDLPIIAAGSLLEFTLEAQEYAMPVGRIEYLHMGPMDFLEFLEAKGESWLLDKMATFQLGDEWPESAHSHASSLLREYFFTGGMPEVVALRTSLQSDNTEWALTQQRLLDTYRDDFRKYSPKGIMIEVLHSVYDRLPSRIGRKLKYSEIIPGERTDRIHKAIDLLSAAGVVLKAHHTHANGIPLASEKDHGVAKPYWMDCGLLNRSLGLNLEFLSPEKFVIHEGPLAEQFIAQHLAYWNDGITVPQLFYWLREGKGANAEVDFLVQSGATIIPY